MNKLLLAITLLFATVALVLAAPTRDELVADARKLSMKELRGRLESFSIVCETCVEKKDYVNELVNYLVAIPDAKPLTEEDIEAKRKAAEEAKAAARAEAKAKADAKKAAEEKDKPMDDAQMEELMAKLKGMPGMVSKISPFFFRLLSVDFPLM